MPYDNMNTTTPTPTTDDIHLTIPLTIYERDTLVSEYVAYLINSPSSPPGPIPCPHPLHTQYSGEALSLPVGAAIRRLVANYYELIGPISYIDACSSTKTRYISEPLLYIDKEYNEIKLAARGIVSVQQRRLSPGLIDDSDLHIRDRVYGMHIDQFRVMRSLLTAIVRVRYPGPMSTCAYGSDELVERFRYAYHVAGDILMQMEFIPIPVDYTPPTAPPYRN